MGYRALGVLVMVLPTLAFGQGTVAPLGQPLDALTIDNRSSRPPLLVSDKTGAQLVKIWNTTGETDVGNAVNLLGGGRLANFVVSQPTNPIVMLEGYADTGPAAAGSIVWSSPSGASADNVLTWILGAGPPPLGSNKAFVLSDLNQNYLVVRRSTTGGAQGQWDFGSWSGAGPASYSFLRSLATQPFFHLRGTLNAGVNYVEMYTDNGAALMFAVDSSGKQIQAAGDSSGTPGAATVNTPVGKSAIAIGASTVTVTNSTVTANSLVRAWIQQAADDATATYVQRVSVSAGSFTIKVNANATAAVTVAWEVVN